jgi:sulfur relay (sulfurtransferase) complex TusBCD TusD component (DsrE family)
MQRWETACHIADAALNRSDQVTFFLFMDGIYNALSTQHFPGVKKVPKDYFQALMDKGAEIYGCEVCTNNRGLEEGKSYLRGIKIAGAGQISIMASTCDRIITL